MTKYTVYQHSPSGSYKFAQYKTFVEAQSIVCMLGQNNDYPTQVWYTIEPVNAITPGKQLKQELTCGQQPRS
jgi:hypothetical protein